MANKLETYPQFVNVTYDQSTNKPLNLKKIVLLSFP